MPRFRRSRMHGRAYGACGCQGSPDDLETEGRSGGVVDPHYRQKVSGTLGGMAVPEDRVARLARAGLPPDAAARVLSKTKSR